MSEERLDELRELEDIAREFGSALDVRQVGEIVLAERRLPLLALGVGSRSPDVPAIGFFGGIHGLERVGTQLLLAFLRTLLSRLAWDTLLRCQLESMRMVFMPLVNPGGMLRRTRANPNGVDLMRNSPVEARARTPFLIGGQRLTPVLPWYRGRAGVPMEIENQALCRVVDDELLSRRFSLSLDCHSGFGLRDRVWFPYAYTTEPIRHLAEMHALIQLFDAGYPHHDYLFEPQTRHYHAHGDLWDYLYLRSLEGSSRVFLPLTLELGSWRWVKKRPRQMFSRLGMFNPLPRHRYHRVMRRHLVWLDFLTRAVCSWNKWLPVGTQRVLQGQAALARWYSVGAS